MDYILSRHTLLFLALGKTTGSHLEEYRGPEIVPLGTWLADCLCTSTFVSNHGMPEMALLKIATHWKLSRYPLRVEETDK